MQFPPVVDCHAHLSRAHLDHDAFGLRQVLSRCDEFGVAGVVFSLCFAEGKLELPLDAIQQAAAPFHCTVGIALGINPPIDGDAVAAIERDVPGFLAAARQLAHSGRIVAVGECGLDHYWPAVRFLEAQGIEDANAIDGELAARRDQVLYEQSVAACLQAQRDVFRACIDLAAELGLPLVVHGRDAYADIFECLADGALSPEQVMLHCFGGTVDEARTAADRGHWISVPSSAAFRESFAAVARAVDLTRIVIETDSPYHSPLVGLWKVVGERTQEETPPAELGKTAAQQWQAQRRRDAFAADVERQYPGLTFDVYEGGRGRSVPAGEYLSASSRRRDNEPMFVRAAATAVAELKELDPEHVCRITTGNARHLFPSLTAASRR